MSESPNAQSPEENAWDAILSEALGVVEPPDLEAVILTRLTAPAAVAAEPIDGSTNSQVDDQAADQVLDPVADQVTGQIDHDGRAGSGDRRSAAREIRRSRRRRLRRRRRAITAALVAVAAGLVAMVSWRVSENLATNRAFVAQRSALQSSPNSDASDDDRVADAAAQVFAKSPQVDPAIEGQRAGSGGAIELPIELPVKLPVDAADRSGPMISNSGVNREIFDRQDSAPDESFEFGGRQPDAALSSIDNVATNLVSRMETRWTQIGLTPTRSVSTSTWRDRVGDVLSVDLPEDVVDAKTLMQWMRRPDNAAALSRVWLSKNELAVNQRSIAVAAELFAENADPADQQIATWIRDWAAPVQDAGSHRNRGTQSGNQSGNQSGVAVAALVSITLGADSRCVVCHDEKRPDHDLASDSLVTQKDFWSIAALIRPNSRRTFFETEDARTELALPGVPASMVDGDQPIQDRSRWLEQTVGSERIARGLAVSVLSMISGSVDSGSFQRDRFSISARTLAQTIEADLMASNFDLARAVAIAFASPPMWRDKIDAETATTGEIAGEDFSRHLREMAAFSPRPMPIRQRLAHHQIRGGQTLPHLDETLLGQIGDATSSGKRQRQPRPDPRGVARQDSAWDYPTIDNDHFDDATTDWLARIGTDESLIEHLLMISQRGRLSAEIRQQNALMRSAGVDDRLRIRQMRWLIQ